MDNLSNNSHWNGSYKSEAKTWDSERTLREPLVRKRSSVKRRQIADIGEMARREPMILAVEDQARFTPGLQTICDFLGIRVERVDSHRDLAPLLKVCRPMAVFCELDGSGQDGCHVMKIVAQHDRTLPLLVVSGDDPDLLGAAEAVEELFNLTSVVARSRLPEIGELVEFLFSAGRKGRCLSLMPG
jgi:hypothetical protein